MKKELNCPKCKKVVMVQKEYVAVRGTDASYGSWFCPECGHDFEDVY